MYEIGPFRLDTQAKVLTRDGVPQPLGPRAVDVLAALVSRAEEYVSKAAILDAAWPGLVVSEGNLAVQIAAVRRVLAQVPGGAAWVETLARRGYRFVGPVSSLSVPVPANAPRRTNLPAPVTSFIGREREVRELNDLLTNARLASVVGTGGAGKTRLVLQVASQLLDHYPDGVWFVDLAPIVDSNLVASAVAHVLGVRVDTRGTLLADLCVHMKSRQLLLVLDNCEHVLEDCVALAAAVLRDTMRIVIVATSREPLRVAGERTYLLAPLSLPDLTATAAQIGESEAVRLFVERAQRQQRDFALTPDRAPVVARLCVRLDGIPLALELAAARIRSLSVEQIDARLDDRFRVLTGGSRTALPRQQTLRAAFDWSYDLLHEQERVALRHLAVFPGAFTLEAAAGVVGDASIDEFAVVDLIAQLVERSLLDADTRGACSHYRLLETTRAYAMEKLLESGDAPVLRRRHAQYFKNFFEREPYAWLQMPESAWRAAYVPQIDNVRVALDWAFAAEGDAGVGVALAGLSGPVWADLSLVGEGRQWVGAAAKHLLAGVPAADVARVWLWSGLLGAMVAPAEAVLAFERAVEILRRISDPIGLGYALLRLGGRLARIGRYDDAWQALAEALPLIERSGVSKLRGDHCAAVGFVHWMQADLAAARASYEKAIPLFERAGYEEQVVNVLGNLAELSWVLGDLDAALGAYRHSVARMRQLSLPEKRLLGTHLAGLAGVHVERGELDLALVATREAVPLLRSAACAWTMLDHLALRAALAGDVEDAARVAGFQDATFAAKKTSRQINELRARERLQVELTKTLGAAALEELQAQGALLDEDEACRLVVSAS